MRVITGNRHIQRVDDIHPGLAAAQDGIDEVVAKVTMRTAMPPGFNSRRQRGLLDPQTALDGFVVAFLAGSVAGKRLIESGILTTDPPRFQVLTLRTADDDPGKPPFGGAEQADLRLE